MPVFGIVLLVAGTIACSSDHPEQRIHKYFGIRPSTNTAQLRQDLLRAVPIGTTEQQLYDRFRRSRISDDRLASWYPADASGVVVFRTGMDTRHLNVVFKEYIILFHLGTDRRLQNIEVKEGLTGL